jgi:hypothetical protein
MEFAVPEHTSNIRGPEEPGCRSVPIGCPPTPNTNTCLALSRIDSRFETRVSYPNANFTRELLHAVKSDAQTEVTPWLKSEQRSRRGRGAAGRVILL